MKKLFQSVLIFIATTTFLWAQSGEELVIRASLPPNISGLTSINGGTLEIKLAVDLTGEDVSLAPYAKNDSRNNLIIRDKDVTVFAGKIEWIAVGTKAFFPKEKGTGSIAKQISAITTPTTGLGSSLEAELEDTNLVVEIANLTLGDSTARTLNASGYDTSTQLYLDDAQNGPIYCYATSSDGRHQIVKLTLGGLAFWKKVRTFWQDPPTDPITTQRIKNTLFRALLTPDGQAFFDESYDAAKYNALTQDRVKVGIDFLDDYARLIFAQLGLGLEADAQTARIPTDRLYTLRQTVTGSLAKAYFSILTKHNQPRELSVNDGKNLAAQSLKYLYGPENQLATVKTLSDKNNLASQLTALYNKETTEWLAKINANPSLTPNLLNASNTAELESREITGAPLSLPAAQELLFVPGGPNLAASNTLVNPAGILSYLWESETLTESVPANNKITLSFLNAQTISYLTFWAGPQFQVTGASVAGSPVTPKVQRLESTIDQQGVAKLVAREGSLPSGDQLYVVTFPQAPGQRLSGTKNIDLQLGNGTKIVKLAVYSDNPAFTNYGWTSSNGVRKLSGVAGKRVTELQVILATPRKIISFLNWGYQTTPLSKNADVDFSPIRYAYGGWETPQSYADKVLNNQLEKVGQLKQGRFPFTELDAFSSRKEINDSGLYKTQPQRADLKPLYGSEASQKPYIYAYGLDLPYPASTLSDSGGPFFAEKLAGVDSLGLITSLLLQKGMSPAFPYVATYTAADRWAARTTDIVGYQAFFPFSESYYSPATFQGLTEPTPFWYEKNSNVVVDIGNLRLGDLIVGYEGTSLVSAVVVSVPDIDTLRSGNLEAIRNKVSVVGISKGLKAAVLTSWQNFSVNPSGYHVRRLVSNPNSDLKAFLKPREISVPRGVRAWIPDTGEMVPIGAPGINADGLATGLLPVTPVFDTTRPMTWSLQDLEATDFSFDPSKADLGNVYNNATAGGPTRFYLISYLESRRDAPVTDEILTNPAHFPGAVVLAEISSVPNQSRMKIESVPNTSVIELLCKPGSSQMGYAHRLVARVKGTDYERFGVLAVNPHPGDDLQLTFKLKDSIVFKTMPMTVYQWSTLGAIDQAEMIRSNNAALRQTIFADTTLDEAERRFALNCLRYIEVINENLYTNPNGFRGFHFSFARQLLSEAVMQQVGGYFLAHPEMGEAQVAGLVSHIDDVATGKIDVEVMAAKIGVTDPLWTQFLHIALEVGISESEYVASLISRPAAIQSDFGFAAPQTFRSAKLKGQVEQAVKAAQPALYAARRVDEDFGRKTNIPFLPNWSKTSILLKIADLKKSNEGKDPAQWDRLNPSAYLPESFIQSHLKKFETEGYGFVFTKKNVEDLQYTSFNPEKYVMLLSDLKKVIVDFQRTGNRGKLEIDLGYSPGQLENEQLFVYSGKGLRLKMGDGFEGGANKYYQPGGFNSGSYREATLDTQIIQHNNSTSFPGAIPIAQFR